MKIKKILIAGRGEIAVRIIQTCREKGMESVTLYTDSEKDYPHVHKAHKSRHLGEGPLSETYLNQEKIITIAKEEGVQAIHPCYGFLSEQASFARRVEEAGLVFIGPSAEVIELMGSKQESKKRMERLGIPIIAGYHGERQEAEFLEKEALQIGFPLFIKASMGGGGKGMRLVENSRDFLHALESAKREALNAFGDDTVLLEQCIEDPHHVEVQLISDTHGNHLHFFERECSIQRRHQKIIEETPSPTIDRELREKITRAALEIARSLHYRGAGTVEFILSEKGEFYFLEMNTRLQVEHPITEMVTGYDLVDLQIQVASGEKLPLTQDDILPRGHAMELRLYGEDSNNDFLPQTGTLLNIGHIEGQDVRLDCGYRNGNEVTIDFDPLLAKLILWSQTRKACLAKAKKALENIPFLGIRTNRDYLARILNHKDFHKGITPTHFVPTHREELRPEPCSKEEKALLLASFLFLRKTLKKETLPRVSQETSWDRISGMRMI